MIVLQCLGILLYVGIAYFIYSSYLPNCQSAKQHSVKSDLLLAIIALLWLPAIILLVGALFLVVLYYAIKHFSTNNKTLEKGNK